MAKTANGLALHTDHSERGEDMPCAGAPTAQARGSLVTPAMVTRALLNLNASTVTRAHLLRCPA